MKLNIQLFAHTNQTANYDLPQFVGTDKPTWLGDFNQAMSDIDAGMHKNASDIANMESDVASATQAASQASQNVTALTTTVNSLSSTVTSVQTTANNASQTASSALNTANTANGKADSNATNITSLQNAVREFNLDTFTTIAKSDTTATGVNSDYTVNLTLATNSHDKTVFKLYGQVIGKLTTYNQVGYISFNTALRPESDITINGAGIYVLEAPNLSIAAIRGADIVVKKTGEVRVNLDIWSETVKCRALLFANLYFLSDFGDTPTPTE